jgi:hypothetical protein
MEQFGEGKLVGETVSTGRKPAPVPFCSPRKPDYVTWVRTRAASVDRLLMLHIYLDSSYGMVIT